MPTPDEAIVVKVPTRLSVEQQLDAIEGLLPDTPVLVLDGACAEILARIEGKLDTLIKALGEDDGEGPAVDLDGGAAGGERDQSQAL